MTVTESGEVVDYAKIEHNPDKYVIRWYSLKGSVKHLIQLPYNCSHVGYGCALSYVQMPKGEHIALSCCECQVIWLWESGTKKWTLAWRGKELVLDTIVWQTESKCRPWKMCHGNPGQIIAVNGVHGDSVSVFDTGITQIPFRVIHEEIKLGMKAHDLCYYRTPSVSYTWESPEPFRHTPHPKGGLAVLDKSKLCWASGIKKPQHTLQFVGQPTGICSDNKGHLFVATNSTTADDQGAAHNPHGRILVFAADTGELLQEMKHDQMKYPQNVFWCDKIKRLIVYQSVGRTITFFKIKCDF